MKFVIGVALVLAATASAASGQGQSSTNVALLTSLAGTTSIEARPVMSEGALAGCTLVFAALHRDEIYRVGGFIKVTGNIGIMQSGEAFGANLKVIVNEIDSTTLKGTPSAPSRAYLLDERLQSNLSSLAAASPSDVPGSIFSVFRIEPLTMSIIFDALDRKRLMIAFNSRNGKTDIQMPIELDVAKVEGTGTRIRSSAMINSFTKCIETLVSPLKK